MNYCTLNDLKECAEESDLIELTDETGQGVIEEDKTDAAIAWAGELIDGYLRGPYNLPLDPVPGILKPLAVELSIYRLYRLKMKLSVPEPIRESYESSVKMLEAIRKGNINLGTLADETDSRVPSTTPVSISSPGDRVFTRETLKGY
jgi:phage gp36-like protein